MAPTPPVTGSQRGLRAWWSLGGLLGSDETPSKQNFEAPFVDAGDAQPPDAADATLKGGDPIVSGGRRRGGLPTKVIAYLSREINSCTFLRGSISCA